MSHRIVCNIKVDENKWYILKELSPAGIAKLEDKDGNVVEHPRTSIVYIEIENEDYLRI